MGRALLCRAAAALGSKVLGIGFKEVLAGTGRAVCAGILRGTHCRCAPRRRAIAEGNVSLRRHAKPPSRCVGGFGSATARAVGSCNLGISTSRRSAPVCSLYDLWKRAVRRAPRSSGAGCPSRLGEPRKGKTKLVSRGAARGNRTPDPVITNDVLYRLSYCGLLLLDQWPQRRHRTGEARFSRHKLPGQRQKPAE